MTKYKTLSVIGGSTLGGLFIFISALVYFSLTRESTDKPQQLEPKERDTVVVEKIIKLPADTIVVVKNCTKKHCTDMQIKPDGQRPDSLEKNKTEDGN